MCVKSSDRLLDQAGNTAKQPRQNSLNSQVTLAGQAWQVRINDLDTSINLNTSNRLSKSTAVTRLLNSVSFSGAQLIINQRQTSEPFDSWGQLWDVSRLTPSQLAEVQQSCTYWGSGKLNLRFVTDKLLHQLGRAPGRTGLFIRVISRTSKHGRCAARNNHSGSRHFTRGCQNSKRNTGRPVSIIQRHRVECAIWRSRVAVHPRIRLRQIRRPPLNVPVRSAI